MHKPMIIRAILSALPTLHFIAISSANDVLKKQKLVAVVPGYLNGFT